MSIKIICDVCNGIISEDKDIYKERYNSRSIQLKSNKLSMDIKTYSPNANKCYDVCAKCLKNELKEILKEAGE